MSPNGRQVILFDLDGTLRFDRPVGITAFLDHAASLGAGSDCEQRRQVTRWEHYYWAQSPEMLQHVQFFGELNDDFWEHYAKLCLMRLGEPAQRAEALAPEMNRYMRDEHQPQDWIPPEVPETLARLRRAGFKLGMLSNRDEPCTAYLEQVGLLQYFDLTLVAGEVSAWKPDPQIFQHALQRLGCTPEQAVYVGDNYYADVLGAKAAGIEAVLLDLEGVFPEVDCTIIRSLDELPEIFMQLA